MLSQAHLSAAELAVIVDILAGYQQQMTALEKAYNAAVAAALAARSASTDWALKDFPAQRDAIVTGTKVALAARLSAPAMARLDQLVQSEKRRMKIVPFPPMH
jgi:hypothetical protein